MTLHSLSGGRPVRRHWLCLSGALALCGPLAATATAGPAIPLRAAAPTRFACDFGIGFDVAFVRGGAWVTTSNGRWLLRRARSSIGRRFASPTATFILDEDRAALVGLPGGPFLRCVASPRGGPRLRPAPQV